ncbi:hypothetical protein Pcac1_g22142 [Phytophthora cactorum]|nr:hypothetical protein Pcac1_g22142 [Phytophthora cactorum]KAG2809406.1 hypothetical protein PC111_g16069 [Phytophthora cactorum]KAG2818066.1 hypothetical protein PC112_g12791 [Phytophthora cactorum]KAG2907370.1 hypothetical protein PC115_g13972 [Phytophthora cactorum]KAG3055194.1 hypothetical protein PC121_g15907 [Phytophthora cactorum]
MHASAGEREGDNANTSLHDAVILDDASFAEEEIQNQR